MQPGDRITLPRRWSTRKAEIPTYQNDPKQHPAIDQSGIVTGSTGVDPPPSGQNCVWIEVFEIVT